MKRGIKSAIMALAFAGFTGIASAYPVMTLDQLLQPGAYMIVGDKMFDHFGFNSGTMTSAGFNIQGIDESSPLFLGNYGIDIQGSFTQIGVGTLDADLTYRVSTLTGQQITGLRQLVNAGGFGLSWAATSTELVLDKTGGQVLANLVSGAAAGANFQVTDAILSAPQTVLLINKDINIVVQQGGIFASISDIQQTFSQIPEPSVLALFGLGLAALIGLRNRR